MDSQPPRPPVEVGVSPDGALTYLVDLPPEALPPVRGRDLEAAWDAARQAALGEAWGQARGFRFRRADGGFTDLALADRDACCWARAVDGVAQLSSSYGLSLLLRLLALVDLLAHARWTAGLFRLARDGAELDPLLLRAAASVPLTPEARFDEALLRNRLPPRLPAPSPGRRLTGAPA